MPAGALTLVLPQSSTFVFFCQERWFATISMVDHHFQIVDVFGDRAFTGNPLAVVFDSDKLNTELMQQMTRWLNLSETAFLLTPSHPEADYRVRIFTLEKELPFAGHPTLGSCHAWLTAGGVNKQQGSDTVVQECGAGLITIQREPLLAFAAPPLLRSGPVEENVVENIASALRLDRSQIVAAQWADNGPGWVVLLLDSAETVLSVKPARDLPEPLYTGIVGPYPSGSEPAFEIRAFFTDQTGALREDPVTGSLNASAAQWLLATQRSVAPYVVSQGTRVGCLGRVHITQDKAGQVWVGGRTQTLISGHCEL